MSEEFFVLKYEKNRPFVQFLKRLNTNYKNVDLCVLLGWEERRMLS